MAGSESKVFEAPSVVVCGVTRYDQNWIDGNVEAGIGAFQWARPKPRPATMGPCPPYPGAKAAPAPHKRPGIVQRVKARLTGQAPQAPAQPAAVPHLLPEPEAREPARAPAPDPYVPRRVDPVLDMLGERE